MFSAIRRIADRDGDGFSSILGGGDCNDSESNVHPLALDIPGDGIDQNCSGADAPPLAAVPKELPQLPIGVPSGLNILLITIDCVRPGHLGVYGHNLPTTPALDAFARQAVVWDQAWSNSSFTIPSVRTIMTGRYVSQVRWLQGQKARIPSGDNGTIGAFMRHIGAQTGAIVWSPGPLGRKLGFDLGFDDFMAPDGISQADNPSRPVVHEEFQFAIQAGKPTFAQAQADLAIEWIRGRAEHRFFLWVHFIDTHPPYGHHVGIPEFGTDDDSMADHELLFTDGQVGRILESLDRNGLRDQTAVFVTSDHGTLHGEHWLPQGRYLYPENTRVPLIVRIPGLPPRRIPYPVSHVDILPTIAHLAGVSIPIPLSGRSLLPLMAGERDLRQSSPIYQMVDEGDQQRRALIDGCSLLIHNILPESTYERYDVCQPGTGGLQDQYDPVRDSSLRETLSKLQDANQVPLPAWIP